MFAQYFGQYLLNQGLLSASELKQAISIQKLTRVKLGVLAINYGYMSAAQVETVHQIQMKLDKKFGEIATELSFLSEEIVSSLLDSQQNAHLALGQVLIDQGIMTYEGFADALEQYKKAYSLTDDQFDSIIKGSMETLLETVLLKGGLYKDPAISDYIGLFAKNLIRFIDSDIRLELSEPGDSMALDWVTEQHILTPNRDISRFTAIGGSESSILLFASKYAQETVDEPGDMMEACIGEFLNLHNGIYLVNLSNQNVELDLEPQIVIRGAAFLPASPVKVRVQVIAPDWSVTLIIGDLSELL
ncbi:hypothetical protein [Paenibacillus radicis (ex Xue et al. 2023)]|uniref:Chemotaxis protein CheX n=1 Tax=Paenibacillus radicis (ex Xue et al. 2023) TaxID=2972489 RepID=A0ABT1YCX4_9BACL|nr:hypothetical protein [Paenibacillus radicis (ex Xue et al. 2023)]MCR8629805.1 hypothetical protein [Paenibacillus radicis (ex Xue et al. 2023)]